MRPFPTIPRVQSSTTSHHQDLDKLSRVLYVRQLHRSSPQHQDGLILTERIIPDGKLYKTGSLVARINKYGTMP
jgi:hypothetical protein